MKYKSLFLEKLKTHIIKKENSLKTTPYRAIMELIYWCVKELFKKQIINIQPSDRIALCILGGIGDICCNISFIKAFTSKLSNNIQIDIYSTISPQTLKSLCYGINIQAMYLDYKILCNEKYICVLKCCRFPEVEYINDELINEKIPTLLPILEQYIYFQKENYRYFWNGTTDDYLGNAYSMLHGLKRWQQADILHLLDVDENIKIECELTADNVLQKFNLSGRKYITLQRGIGEKGEATRCWPLENYEKLATLLKQKYPDYILVQIGSETASAIKNTDIDLRGKTSFEEVKVLLRNAELHIDGEGGLVHLRHCLGGGKSVVIFGPTNKEFYGYDENINMQSPVCSGCEWLTMNWQDKCPKGCTMCERFSTITLEMVMNEIEAKGLRR